MRLDFIQTVAFAGLVLFAGYGLKRMVPVLARYNIPAPVVGGLPVAALFALLHAMEWPAPTFDTTLQTPLQNTFFASIGFGASVLVLKRGGPLVAIMMVVASVAAVLQNVVGGVTALALGQHPLMGVLAGSTTLTGGPATGLAFAPLFEEAGVTGAATLAVSAAMGGIVAGGLIGGPVATYLLQRRPRLIPVQAAKEPLMHLVEERTPEPLETAPVGEDVQAYGLIKHLVLLAVSVGAGAWVSAGIEGIGVAAPGVYRRDDRRGLDP
jgi:ESS family glutamate:Na+ symporter